MKSNSLLKIAIPTALFICVLLIFWPSKKTDVNVAQDVATISPEDARLLGIEGDTPRDTLATLVGQMKNVRREIDDVKKQNDALVKENERLRGREAAVDSRVEQAVKQATSRVDDELKNIREQSRGVLGNLGQTFGRSGERTDRTDGSSETEEDLPVGLGLQPGDGRTFSTPFDAFSKIPFGRQQQQAAKPTAGGAFEIGGGQEFGAGMVWIEPSDGIALDPKTQKPTTGASIAFPTSFAEDGPLGELSDAQRQYRQVAKGEKDLDKGKKKRNEGTKEFFTIAENSTLMGSKTMTALIGRVPIDGMVSDPYPFKVLIGKDNLAANGIELPDITGAVMSGMATGDWTLSCVRGQIESITFVFEDGSIRTVPEPEATVRRGQSGSSTSSLNSIRGGIGYLSDPHGIPCIAGLQRSNAAEYLTTQSLITAAGAIIASEFSKDGVSGGISGGSVMSDRNAALNSILSGGVRDISSWVNRLYGQAFAAIYVPPHAEVAVHIDREITIDYEPHGRMVNYHAAESKVSLDLD